MGSFKSYINSLPRPLSDTEQDYLLRDYYALRDEGARQLLISHNLRLCAYYANKYASSPEEFEELMSVATIELINVIDNKFDLSKGFKFSTYASISLIGAITNETHRDIRTKEALVRNHLSFFNGEIPGVDLENENFAYDPYDNIIEDISFKDNIRHFMATLNDREKIIARYYHCLLGDKKIPTKELAKKLGISTSLVNLIAKNIKERLRDYLKNDGVKLDPRREALLNYLSKVKSGRERAVIEHFYGLNDKEKLTIYAIARQLNISYRETLNILDNVNKGCGYEGNPREVSNEDIKNYLVTSRSELINRIGGYYSDQEGSDKEKLNKTFNGLGLERSQVYGVIRNLKIKIAKDKLKAEQVEGYPIITKKDIIDYYNDDTIYKDKEFMEYLYGLNGREKKYIKELAEIFDLSQSTVRKKIDLLESKITRYILEREDKTM